MLEGEYLDMVNHLKSQFDEKDKESEKLRENYEFLKKTFLSVYGFIRIIDITDEYSDKESLLEILRSYLSQMYDTIGELDG